MVPIEGDRRHAQRVAVHRPCKLYEPRSARYIAAGTCDISQGGLLLDVPALMNVKAGDLLHVGVAVKRRQAVLLPNEMMQAIVVRIMPTVDDHTLLAVRLVAQAEESAEASSVQRIAA
jgi:hypothetical protein